MQRRMGQSRLHRLSAGIVGAVVLFLSAVHAVVTHRDGVAGDKGVPLGHG